jgi:putative addiction module CopG family antidote
LCLRADRDGNFVEVCQAAASIVHPNSTSWVKKPACRLIWRSGERHTAFVNCIRVAVANNSFANQRVPVRSLKSAAARPPYASPLCANTSATAERACLASGPVAMRTTSVSKPGTRRAWPCLRRPSAVCTHRTGRCKNRLRSGTIVEVQAVMQELLMTVELPTDVQSIVRKAISSGRCSDETDVVRRALKLYAEFEECREALQREIRTGVESGDSIPGDLVFQELEELADRLAQGAAPAL